MTWYGTSLYGKLYAVKGEGEADAAAWRLALVTCDGAGAVVMVDCAATRADEATARETAIPSILAMLYWGSCRMC